MTWVLCVGAAHWDTLARADGPVAQGDDVPGRVVRRPGGVALNVALAGAGCETRLCAALGEDAEGAALTGHLRSRGVDCTPILRVPGEATDAYVAVEDGQGALVAAVAGTGLPERHGAALADLATMALPGAETVFVDANLPAVSLREIAGAARDAGVRVVTNPVSPAKALRLEEVLGDGSGTAIVANLVEAGVLCSESHAGATEAARALVARGAGLALVTDGPRPAALATATGVVSASPARVPFGASVTGAGDALAAGFIAADPWRGDPRAVLGAALDAAARHMRTAR